ncbi:MAG: aldehyde ferredoxin oxidoreductase C-terminal domain-containing protein, partial [Dehalococcoidales bacterium]|nr:aldehyde ferredoxin oxidoreductase C-terminal domain-containing protein [Dehalococcoidales bacterium]
LRIYHQCELYGLDSKSITAQIALAIKLYEKGILTGKDTGGMHLEFGDEKSALWLIDKIARREGIGDALADGVYRAARRIGRGAEEFARHVKKLDLVQRREGGGESGPGSITTAIADGGGGEKLIGSNAETFWERAEVHTPEEKAAYLESEYYHFPEEFKKYLLPESNLIEADYEGTLLFISHNEETFALADATGLCYYWVGHHPSPPISSRPLIASLISAATGMDIDEAKATRVARRIIRQVRSYDVRTGIRRKDDSMPEKHFQKDPRTGKAKLDRDLFNKWLDKWYELKRWNQDGIPTREALEEVGLDDVLQELEQRRILSVSRDPVTASPGLS